MKYIIVTGGSLSGIGKGVVASSTGVILQSRGCKVTFIKIDPYLNIDAGTLTPFDHGEVFVLRDGTEVDLDLGNYERFLDIDLSNEHCITTGKIYSEVIRMERKGDYMGKTVQIIPHVTNMILNKIMRAAEIPVKNKNGILSPEICIVELGGTIGDIESNVFVEALRQLRIKVGNNNFMVISVEHIPELINGELKTKPVQHSTRTAISLGIKPDIIVTRCNKTIDDVIRNKISNFCEVGLNNIYQLSDLSSVYEAPSNLDSQGYYMSISNLLKLNKKIESFDVSKHFSILLNKYEKTVRIGIVGKYICNSDCYLSISNALRFSGAHLECNVDLVWIESSELEEGYKFDMVKECHAILIPGGFGGRGVEGKILAIKHARENNIPILGICLGFQLMVIEFCRNVIGLPSANSEEFDESAEHKVITRIPELSSDGIGGTLRLGDKEVYLLNGKVKDAYGGAELIMERHRHRYEVNPQYVELLEKNGLRFVGKGDDGLRMEICEFDDHPFMVAVQYHPEFNARPKNPQCLFTALIKNALNNF
ncbi:CTP synthase [Astathelohania contejeani]|uniref:CTP synthase n=1 Tax=Astathelohania contejeani TaxID=164912 RepID=A0ABQ7I138_9MICR|nr:CTP synthase [Thelohania contejeani]